MKPCAECEERRRKFVAMMHAMHAWIKNPVGPPPITQPIPDQQPKITVDENRSKG